MNADPDLDGRRQARRTGLLVTLAASLALIAAVLLASHVTTPPPPKLAVAKPAAPAAQVRPHTPRSHDEEFRSLIQSDAPLAASYLAYDWIKQCLNEREFAARKVEYWPSCGLSDRNVDNVELRRQLVTRLARAGSFCAIEDLHWEGPNSSFRAFADDPKGHARLLEEAHDVGLAMGEPCVLSGEAVNRQSRGDLWRLVGATQRAREEYLRALAYSIASVAGLAKQNGAPLPERDDPKMQEALRKYGDRLEPQDRDAAIAEGERIAQGWQPLLTPRQRVEGRLPT